MKWMVVGVAVGWNLGAYAGSMSILCREQVEAGRVPIACYQESYRVKRADRRAHVVAFLDQRCLRALARESRLPYLDNLFRHPLITKTCREFVERRRYRVRYAIEDAKPLEVIESLIDEGR